MAMLGWEELEQTCLSCRKCALADTRHNVVFGVGPRDAEICVRAVSAAERVHQPHAQGTGGRCAGL